MVIVWALSWWYGAGFVSRLKLFRERMASATDYFSIDLLIKSLFAPFRQISAGKVRGPLGLQWRAFVDRLISRAIGVMIRSTVIVIGAVWLSLLAVGNTIVLLCWLIVPLLPIVGVILMASGWLPAWTL